MNKSESIKNLSKALQEFHGHMGKVIKSETNPFFKSKYADLATILTAIKDPLQKSGLTFSQHPEGQNNLTTILVHPESGEFIESTYEMTPSKNDPQGQGSTITYQRRYALGAVLGLNIDEDDDGNAGSTPPKPSATASPVLAQNIASSRKPISAPQAYKIKSLRTQKGLDQLTDDQLRKLSSTEASKEIERLIALETPEIITIDDSGIDDADIPA